MRNLFSYQAHYVISTVIALIALIVLVNAATGTPDLFDRTPSSTLRIATTTSLDDSGLLGEILPDFEDLHGVKVEVIAVGTGQALMLGERGDVDLVFVHAPELEERFVSQGYGVDRTTIMSNSFVIVGPEDDPAGVSEARDAADALARIADHGASFLSRGDDSGTHMREISIWDAAGYSPDSDLDWYYSAGQGMGETLLTAHQLMAYTLTDRPTFTAMHDRIPGLVALYRETESETEVDPLLENPYSVIAVNPDRHPAVQIDLTHAFFEWLKSEAIRERIAEYGVEAYGEPLFTLVE